MPWEVNPHVASFLVISPDNLTVTLTWNSNNDESLYLIFILISSSTESSSKIAHHLQSMAYVNIHTVYWCHHFSCGTIQLCFGWVQERWKYIGRFVQNFCFIVFSIFVSERVKCCSAAPSVDVFKHAFIHTKHFSHKLISSELYHLL